MFRLLISKALQGGPVARLGPLGWTCIGPPDKNTEYRTRSFLSRSLFTRTGNVENGLTDCCSIDRSIRNFWEVENIGTDKASNRRRQISAAKKSRTLCKS